MPLSRKTPMKRTAFERKLPFAVKAHRPKSPSNPDAPTVELVLARAMSRGHLYCEICADRVTGERGVDWALHHRRGRDGRPDAHSPQNLLVVHGRDNVTACHGRAHRNREGESGNFGWLISRNGINRDPLRVPLLTDNGSRWVYLSADGQYVDEPEGGLWGVIA